MTCQIFSIFFRVTLQRRTPAGVLLLLCMICMFLFEKRNRKTSPQKTMRCKNLCFFLKSMGKCSILNEENFCFWGKTMSKIRLMTHNLWRKDNNSPGWEEKGYDCSAQARSKGFVKLYGELAPDVIGCQEVSPRMAERRFFIPPRNSN